MPHSAFDNYGRPNFPLHVLVPAGASWRDSAACRNHPTLKPGAWDDYAPGDHKRRAGRIAAAIAVCKNECPVTDACLRDADLEWDEGIRGGVDLRELRKKILGKQGARLATPPKKWVKPCENERSQGVAANEPPGRLTPIPQSRKRGPR